MLQMLISRCLMVFVLFSYLSYALGSSCLHLCTGFFEEGKCCDDDLMFPKSRPTLSDSDGSRFPDINGGLIFIVFASLAGSVFVIIAICSCFPCCPLYERIKRDRLYKRFESDNSSSKEDATQSAAALPQPTQAPSITIVSPYPLQVNYAQPDVAGQVPGPTVCHQVSSPQAAMQR